jgi:hypothetical protein
MDNNIYNEKRETTSLMLLSSEKKLYKSFARKKGWSTGKLLRVCARAFILYSEKKARSMEEAVEMAVYLDQDYREG